MRIVIAAGGTAGHVNPATSAARAMTDAEVLFFGRPGSLEESLVATAGFAFREIDVRGLDRGNLGAAPVTVARAGRATLEAGRMLQTLRPDAVLGMGGYVSLPVCLAAALRRIPVVIHEQNIVFGLANKVTKPFARSVAVSFRESLATAGRRGVFTGNPVSPEIARFDRDSLRERAVVELGLDKDRRTILVFGGSQGATRLNAVATGLVEILAPRRDLQILHVTGGRGDASPTKPSPGDSIGYRAVEFITDMTLAYAAADVAVTRGGATTVAELCATSLPAVIVPYPHHRDRQQERHAAVLAKAGAAVSVADDDATPERIASIVTGWLDKSRELERRALAARRLARPDAALELARVVAATAGLAL